MLLRFFCLVNSIMWLFLCQWDILINCMWSNNVWNEPFRFIAFIFNHSIVTGQIPSSIPHLTSFCEGDGPSLRLSSDNDLFPFLISSVSIFCSASTFVGAPAPQSSASIARWRNEGSAPTLRTHSHTRCSKKEDFATDVPLCLSELSEKPLPLFNSLCDLL